MIPGTRVELVDLTAYLQIFWDFDGVIKESVTVKSDAFEKLFMPFGSDLAKRVRAHHEEHSGVSRFEKIPLYLSWAGENIDADTVRYYSEQFSNMVTSNVIESSWVPGVQDYLLSNASRQHFTLVTATPYEEIMVILSSLKLDGIFKQVFGAPTSKFDGISKVLENAGVDTSKSVMIGDSRSDYQAAIENGIDFVLRRTSINQNLQHELSCMMINDFKTN